MVCRKGKYSWLFVSVGFALRAGNPMWRANAIHRSTPFDVRLEHLQRWLSGGGPGINVSDTKG